MKKRILFTLGILTFFTFIFANVKVCAETTEPSTSVETEVITTLPSDEDLQQNTGVSLEDQLSDFSNKWGTGIISALLGVLGSGSIIFLAKGTVKKISTKITDGINLTEEERKKATEDLKTAKKVLEDNSIKYEKYVSEIKELIPNMTAEFKALIKQYEGEMGALKNTVETLTKDFSVARELIAILISQNPELAKNGVATEILKVLTGKDVTINE